MSEGIHEKGLGTQGLEIELQDPSHLFRHASEITKGNKNLWQCLMHSNIGFLSKVYHFSIT